MLAAMEALLEQQEEFCAKPYRDSRGFLTIGYGTNLDAGITRPMAAAWMYDVLAKNREALEKRPWFNAISVGAQDIIENMTYNLGLDGMLGFGQMVAALSQTPPEYAVAAVAMRNSLWARQIPNRAGPLADAMEKCQTPTSQGERQNV